MSPDLPRPIRAAIDEALRLIGGLYGSRMERLVLYGSVARGDSREDSDVDLLVVLSEPIDTLAEIRKLAPIAIDIWSRFEVDLQLMPFSAVRYADPYHPFSVNVRQDAIEVDYAGARA